MSCEGEGQNPHPQPHEVTEISVAIYSSPEKGTPHHWALWLKTIPAEESVILQITDNMYGYGYRLAEPIYTSPFRSQKLESIIECASIHKKDHERAVDAILNYPVHNREPSWNCQSWVLECLDLLVHMGVIDADSMVGREFLEGLQEQRS
ncbi:hypothetical protein N7454_007513 [Penicillium verhagenii]|nr:hypothetical protein N7454_007513 [Penicillium verhagenii]